MALHLDPFAHEPLPGERKARAADIAEEWRGARRGSRSSRTARWSARGCDAPVVIADSVPAHAPAAAAGSAATRDRARAFLVRDVFDTVANEAYMVARLAGAESAGRQRGFAAFGRGIDSGRDGADSTVEIQMPQMGESVTEGTVLEWHVSEGDFVEEGDTVVEVSTDKVDAEVPAPASGTITKLLVEVDDEVKVGAALAELEPGAAPRRADARGKADLRRRSGASRSRRATRSAAARRTTSRPAESAIVRRRATTPASAPARPPPREPCRS